MAARIAEPVARRLRDGDWGRLATFQCTDGHWYADDVQRFVRQRLRDFLGRRREHLDTTVVVLVDAVDENDIIAVGVHEIDDQVIDGTTVEGSYLVVGAVRCDMQGAIVDVPPLDGDRPVTVGRWLMQVLIDDLPQRAGAVRAIVARDNHRSLKLCDRIGLLHEQDDQDPRFVTRLGRLG